MRVIRDGIKLCVDCMSLHETGDASSLDYHYGVGASGRLATIEAGLKRLGPHLVPAWDSETGEGYDEFSWRTCSCCGSHLGGARYDYVILGED